MACSQSVVVVVVGCVVITDQNQERNIINPPPHHVMKLMGKHYFINIIRGRTKQYRKNHKFIGYIYFDAEKTMNDKDRTP